MLAIRMQRTGRKGHAQFRVVVQDSRMHPSSGRVVAYLGSYNPHTKEAIVDAEKAAGYLSNGAQPSERVATLLKKEGVELPAWVNEPSAKKKTIRHPEKLRRNRPPEAKTEKPAEEEAAAAEAVTTEAAPEQAVAAEGSAPEEVAAEKPPQPEIEVPEAKSPAEELPVSDAETPAEPEEKLAEAEAPAEPEATAKTEPDAADKPAKSA